MVHWEATGNYIGKGSQLYLGCDYCDESGSINDWCWNERNIWISNQEARVVFFTRFFTCELVPGNFSGDQHDDERGRADRRQHRPEERQAAAVSQRSQLEARVDLENDQG